MDDDDRMELQKMQERIFDFKQDDKHFVLPEEVGWTTEMMGGRLDQMSVNKFRKPKNDGGNGTLKNSKCDSVKHLSLERIASDMTVGD